MQVDSGSLETYLQYCPDPCAPWWRGCGNISFSCIAVMMMMMMIIIINIINITIINYIN